MVNILQVLVQSKMRYTQLLQSIFNDATMDRIILQVTLTSKITDPSGKTPPASALTVESLQPSVKGNEKNQITIKKRFCWKIQFTGPLLRTWMSLSVLQNLIRFNPHSGPAQSLIPVQIKYELAPTNTKSTVGGEPYPATKEFEAKTGSDGKWSLQDDQLQFGTKYQLTESFNDASGQNHKVSQAFQTNDEKSEITFPKQYYDDFVPCEIDGKITSEGGIYPSNVPVSLQCDAFGENKVPIDLKTNTDSTGSYQFKWKMLMNANSNVDGLLISHETAKFQQTIDLKQIPIVML